MEIDPVQTMSVNGPVLCNANIWEGSSTLIFNSTVSAVGTNNTTQLDPFSLNYPNSDSSTTPYSGTPLANFALGTPISGNASLNIGATLTFPFITNTKITNAEDILNLPPPGLGASPTTYNAAAYNASNQVYLFNASDIIISNASYGTNGIAHNPAFLTGTTVNTFATNFTIWYQDKFNSPSLKRLTNDFYITRDGTYTNPNSLKSTNILYAGYSFVTNVSFYDYRESKTVQAVQLDVAKFNKWLTNSADEGPTRNGVIEADYGHGIASIYIYNSTPMTITTLPAARLVNGQQLPSTSPFGFTTSGLTVATPQPLYILGNYNVQTNGGSPVLGLTNNTASTYPAAVMADAVTILSTNWNDSFTNELPSGTAHGAGDTTVNCAMLEGIVPTDPTISGDYSGGVENFMRLLEDWTANGPSGAHRPILTYNGSIVVMFPSIYATNHWQNIGNYYNAPKRNWAFDLNFNSPALLPPLTPQAINFVNP